MGLGLSALGSGCSRYSGRSPDACPAFIASLDCGDFDFSTVFPDGFCDPFYVRDCDFSDYFICLEEGAECDAETSTYTVPPCLPPPCVFEG